MLKISEETTEAFQRPCNEEWVRTHLKFLKETAPEDIVYYSEEEFYSIVERMLTRAESLALRHQETTSAFCYCSLKLGIGFEVNEKYLWAHKIAEITADNQADYIWRHLHEEVGADKADNR